MSAWLLAAVTFTTDLPKPCTVTGFFGSCTVSKGHDCALELPDSARQVVIDACVPESRALAPTNGRYQIVERRMIYDNPLPPLLGLTSLVVGVVVLAAGIAIPSMPLDIAGPVIAVGGFGLAMAWGRAETAALPSHGELIEVPAAQRQVSLAIRF